MKSAVPIVSVGQESSTQWGDALRRPSREMGAALAPADQVQASHRRISAGDGKGGGPPGIPSGLLRMLQAAGADIEILHLGDEPDTDDQKKEGTAQLASFDSDPSLAQELVHIQYSAKDWLEYLKSGKKIPGLIAQMSPSRELPVSPNQYLGMVQGNEVSPRITISADGAGLVTASVHFPWLSLSSDQEIESPFTKRSIDEASVRLRSGIDKIFRKAPSGIRVRVNEDDQSVQIALIGPHVADEEMESQLKTFFAQLAATIDFSRRLVGAEAEQKLQLKVETPPRLETRGAMGGGSDLDVHSLLLKQKPTERLSDIGGNTALIERLQEVIDFHKNREHYQKFGVELPRGVLLEGPPGTGKTLAARVLAGELGVNFYVISSSDLLSPWFGQSEKNVKQLFDAVETPAILFFDEIDAIGQQRNGSDSVSARVLGEVLRQMDGLGSRPDLLVLGATNRKEVLDPALLRTGRLNHHVYVGLPDKKGREEILKIHLRNASAQAHPDVRLFSPELDINHIADASEGCVGSDLREIVRRTVSAFAKASLGNSAKASIGTNDFLRQIALFKSERESKRQSGLGFDAIIRAREAKERMQLAS